MRCDEKSISRSQVLCFRCQNRTAGNRLFPHPPIKTLIKNSQFPTEKRGREGELGNSPHNSLFSLSLQKLFCRRMDAAAFPAHADLCFSSEPVRTNPALEEGGEDEFQRGTAPLKYIPLCDVYSATSPCLTATGSKKVKAAARRPPRTNGHDQLNQRLIGVRSGITHVYTRRRKRVGQKPSFLESLILQGLTVKSEELEVDGGVESGIKRRRVGPSTRMMKSRDDCKESDELDDGPLLRNCLQKIGSDGVKKSMDCNGIVKCDSRKRKSDCLENNFKNSGAAKTKKWVCLSSEGSHPNKFVGLECKVFWPLDTSWYTGHIVSYNSETGRHHVKYEDDEEENLIISNELMKFHVSYEEMHGLKLKPREKSSGAERTDMNELMVLAASFDVCQEIEEGDVIWAKLTGHAIWPAIVVDESLLCHRKGLNKISGEKSVPVQFFGTHDFARVRRKQVIPFLKGLLSSCHSKCKKPTFVVGLEEVKLYLSEQKIPPKMLEKRDFVDADINSSGSGSGEHEDGFDSGDEGSMSHDEIKRKIEELKSCQLDGGELQIIKLGRIVTDSFNFQNERFIWPEGYTAVRRFLSVKDPNIQTSYKMEVLRDVDSRTRPLFQVTADNGEEFNGPTPSACWSKIYKRIRVAQIRNRDYKADQSFSSGSYMFGFAHPKVAKLIKEMSNSQPSLKTSLFASRKIKGFSAGYRPVIVEWRDLDKCNVCHMDEEYENNLFLQCDKCRMMVHARCYGELEPTGGVLWLCNLCRPGAPESPRCCLCPVVGGAMKPTTDGRWAHLACAIWIPETCLSDIKKMEPIDGISRISKDRWKLLCSICGVSHGACIQCSNFNCRVAYHPLCARVAGLCLEPEDMEKQHLVPLDEDEEDQCIQLLSFCRKHRPSSNEHLAFDERIEDETFEHANYVPPTNPSGCARSEPYNFLTRRGRNEPEAPAASSKRMYVENQPHLLGGCSPRMPLWNKLSSREFGCSKYSFELQKLQISQLDPSGKILSLADKYNYMRDTFRKRLAFGKSGIHGFGVFTKLPHKAGDMVIEYTGELIRPPVADRREHLIYNSLVGAGTYMFRIDDERVIDATRAGSIAHLINHSCKPNCYSRVISVNGDEHIIIFAKRDLEQWEELTYDYRFFSKDERLVCYCGSSICRGVVNDIETEERVAKLYVPCSELKDWQGE